WTKDGEILVLNRPTSASTPIQVTAPETARGGRLIGLQIGAYRIPTRALDRHLFTRGISTTRPWPANILTIPDIAVQGPMRITLGPPQIPPGVPETADLFAIASLASTYASTEVRAGIATFP